MLTFAALTPHPPIIIPEIGKDEAKKVKKTIEAMQKLARALKKSSPDTIIVISPHGLVYPDRINICGMELLRGSLAQFGVESINYKFKNDILLAQKIDKAANKNGIQALLYHNGNSFFELDHGIVVPLYFLVSRGNQGSPSTWPGKARPSGKATTPSPLGGLWRNEVKILPIAYSFQDKGLLFAFGEIIFEIAQKSKKKIALIASGDLSHRLIQTAPLEGAPLGQHGYSESGPSKTLAETGKEFDKLLLNYLKDKDTQGILEMDDDFIEEAGECGYRSILMLIGALSKINFETEILSYEGPFGVGYAVVNFALQN